MGMVEEISRNPPVPNTVVEADYVKADYVAIFISAVLCVAFFPLWFLSGIKVVREFERGVLFRLGKVTSSKASSPGLVLILPCIDELRNVDCRTKTADVPMQQILTKDSVSVLVNGVVDFRVFGAVASIQNVENSAESTLMMAQTTLRNVLGEYTLSELLQCREEIASRLKMQLDAVTDPWEISVERVTMKELILPENMQRSLAAEAEEKQGAKARMIKADGEKQAAEILTKAAEEIEKSGVTIQLRYLDTIKQISQERSSTIVVPFPTEVLE